MTQHGRWSAEDIPDLSGKTAIVTGANSGIGFEAARELARKRAHVVLACRDLGKAHEAIAQIHALLPSASLEAMPLDLASLASVRRFAEDFAPARLALDLLLNNAGVMAIPCRKTADGFEMQLGTNHLGHFALTGLLLAPLLATPAARVVNVSSDGAPDGHASTSTICSRRRATASGRRTRRASSPTCSSPTSCSAGSKRQARARSASPATPATPRPICSRRARAWTARALMESVMELGNRLFAQSAAMGALPTLYAATAPDVRGGDYIGPDGFMENSGHPKKVTSTARSHDRQAARLWEISEQLTAVRYAALLA